MKWGIYYYYYYHLGIWRISVPHVVDWRQYVSGSKVGWCEIWGCDTYKSASPSLN